MEKILANEDTKGNLSLPHTNNSHTTISKYKHSSIKSAKDLYALSPKKAWRWP